MHTSTRPQCELVLAPSPYVAAVIRYPMEHSSKLWPRSVSPLSSNINQTDGKVKSKLIIISRIVPKILQAN